MNLFRRIPTGVAYRCKALRAVRKPLRRYATPSRIATKQIHGMRSWGFSNLVDLVKPRLACPADDLTQCIQLARRVTSGPPDSADFISGFPGRIAPGVSHHVKLLRLLRRQRLEKLLLRYFKKLGCRSVGAQVS